VLAESIVSKTGFDTVCHNHLRNCSTLQCKLLRATQAMLITVKAYSEIWESWSKLMTWHFF